MLKKITLLLFLIPVLLKAQPPKSYSSSEILLQLKKLNTVGSVLYIAAHPDDENTRLIAYLANEKCLRTGYLSLTRGDGGQNLIGPEQGVELGLIRTQELLAARRIDGGEQFFTRAYDFGFSKTPEETFEKWNHDSILSDVVWVIRNFRPDIIISRFATDGSGGHGHHTASGILAEEAFDAAADSTRFPEQLKYVKVWQARRMFYNTTARFRDPKADMSKYIKLDVGGYNALLGKSYGEIAAESRSMHKSQGFGSARQRGEFLEHFKPIKGDTANLKDIFDRIDFSWKRVKGGEKIGKLCEEAIKKYKIDKPEDVLPELLKIEHFLTGQFRKHELVYNKNILKNIILATMGVTVELNCNETQINIGGMNKITFTAINRSSKPIEIEDIFISAPLGDLKKSIDSVKHTVLNPNQLFTFNTYSDLRFIKKNKITTQPFWLETLPDGIFKISKQTDIGKPEDYTSYLSLNFKINANLKIDKGTSLESLGIDKTYPVQYRWVDPEKGELYRPLVIIPPVLLTMENEVLVFSDDNSKEIKVKVKAGKDSLNAKVKLQIPAGWKLEPSEINVSLFKKNEEQTVSFKVTPPSNISQGIAKAIAEVNGETYTKSIREIKYDHIPIQTWFPEAEAKLLKLDVKKTVKRIGYIPGAGDEVQQCLSQLGYEVVTITDAMVANDDFKNFNTIITGIRAYNTNPLLTTYKQKLMDYVSNGGNLIVQYNTNSFAGPFKGDFGPKPFKLTRERVTDEHAKVNFDLPNHPVLNTPNKITERDFEGWIQERGIYFAGDIDSTYECPLSMNDKGEKPNKGSLIISKHGKGNFIYTALVFFRELPAGVPGAYRLMVNLVEMK
ncbi:MAG: PIG-L family deacetylase [Bacteroidia bacterium]